MYKAAEFDLVGIPTAHCGWGTSRSCACQTQADDRVSSVALDFRSHSCFPVDAGVVELSISVPQLTLSRNTASACACTAARAWSAHESLGKRMHVRSNLLLHEQLLASSKAPEFPP